VSVTYVIRFEVEPGRRERFLALLNRVLDAMRQEASFRNAVLHADPSDPCAFLLYETWADHEEVLEVQLKRPYREAWHAALEEVLRKPQEIGIWQALRADGALA
jgi:autoinducer 2-degrading protein